MRDNKRYSRVELEVACISAHMSGRVYAASGEKATPVDEYHAMLKRAVADVEGHRKAARRFKRFAA